MVLVEHAQLLVPPISTPDIPGAGFARWVLFEHTPLRILDVGRPAVLFFFVLSGYVLTHALLRWGSPGLLAFAAQRSIRLMLPVAASVLLSVGLYLVFFDADVLPDLRDRILNTWLEPPTVAQILGNALLLSTSEDLRLNIPLWSLVQEWRLTVLMPLVLLFRERPLQVVVIAAMVMLAGQMLGAREDEIQLGADLRGSIASTLYFALPIGIGAALAVAGEFPQLGARERILLGTLVLVMFSVKSDLGTYIGSAVLIVIAQQPGILQRSLRRPTMVLLGTLSFSLYLVHVPVLVASMYALHGAAPPVVAASIGALLALPAAALMRATIEKPSQRLGRWAENHLAAHGLPAIMSRKARR